MDSDFVSSDQKIMSDALNYRDFLFSILRRHVRGHVLEIGAGIGNMTSVILENLSSGISSYTCIEPDKSCCGALEAVLGKCPVRHELICGKFPEVMTGRPEKYDLVFSYNVMEHISDDEGAFRACASLLSDGGTLFVFVPAFMCIFGSMDEQLRHFRRYSKKELARKLRSSGFDMLKMKYCNALGFVGWFVNNRILKIKSQKPGQVAIFDKLVLPVQGALERIVEPPFGQNIYAVARKAGRRNA